MRDLELIEAHLVQAYLECGIVTDRNFVSCFEIDEASFEVRILATFFGAPATGGRSWIACGTDPYVALASISAKLMPQDGMRFGIHAYGSLCLGFVCTGPAFRYLDKP